MLGLEIVLCSILFLLCGYVTQHFSSSMEHSEKPALDLIQDPSEGMMLWLLGHFLCLLSW